jgi:hypothetical protein
MIFFGSVTDIVPNLRGTWPSESPNTKSVAHEPPAPSAWSVLVEQGHRLARYVGALSHFQTRISS